MSIARTWTLDDGLNLVRALQDGTRNFGYHLALGGGVLNNGKSEKDVDLYFLPLDNKKLGVGNPEGLVGWLQKMWGPVEDIGPDYGPSVSFDVETSAPTSSFSIPPAVPFPSGIPAPPPTILPSGSTIVWGASNPGNSWAVREGAEIFRTNYFDSGSLNDFIDSATAPVPAPRVGGPYKYKLKFNRKGDRIDVFVV